MVDITLPNRYYLTCGKGDGPTELNAFDRALVAADIGSFNLVKVTSILPPAAKPGSLGELKSGEIVYTAIASLTSRSSGDLISAAVAVGIPEDIEKAGVLMEGYLRGSSEEAEKHVCRMAEQAMEDRGVKNYRIDSVAVEWRIQKVGAVVAAVLLWKR